MFASLLEAGFHDARRTAGDQRGHARGFADLLGAEIVAIGVAGALARDDANADAQRHALAGALDDAFVDADGAGGEVFEIQIGVLSAGRERFAQVGLQITLGDAEFRGEE